MSKVKALIGVLLSACMGWSWIIGCDGVSAVLFGEHEYPADPEANLK